jgi:hypothetical protein
MHEEYGKRIQNFVRNKKVGEDFQELKSDERIILRWLLSNYDIDWVHLAEGRIQWYPFVNTVTKLRFSYESEKL